MPRTPDSAAALPRCRAGYLNDLFSFSPGALSWSDLSSYILGDAPSARFGHMAASTGDFLYTTGGIALSGAPSSPIPDPPFLASRLTFYAGSVLDDMYSIPTPRVVGWPDAAEFLVGFAAEAYDWDTVQLQAAGAGDARNVLPNLLPLCTMGLPCSLAVDGGSGAGALSCTGAAGISCAASDGCEAVTVTRVAFNCSGQLAKQAPVRVDGILLVVVDSYFDGCRSLTDGAAIQALEAQVVISNTTFANVSSEGSGGAISLVGSTAELNNCSFLNCTSSVSGGAVSITDYECTSSKMIFAAMRMQSSLFVGCRSQRGGGLVSNSGSLSIVSTAFIACESETAGGALFLSDGDDLVYLNAKNSKFEANVAKGQGGGAMFLANSHTELAGLSCSNNEAPNGGGGVVLWDKVAPTILCAKGSIEGDNEGECMLCPPGKFQVDTGSSFCLACPAGTFSEAFGSSFCSFCGPGKYSDIEGLDLGSSCKPCSTGTYQSGHGMQTFDCCALCIPGSYSTQSAAEICLLCQAGKYATAAGAYSSAACTGVCPPGEFSIAGASACDSCAAGSFSTGWGMGAFFVADQISTPCQQCISGEYFSSIGSTRCNECAPGYYSSGEGGSTCMMCLPGSFSALNGSSSCEYCSAGSEAAMYGSTECIPCPQGFTTEAPSSILSCTSTSNNTLCSLNTECFDMPCAQGTIGRLIPGEAYDNGELITWIISSQEEAMIFLEFTMLSTEDIYDAVEVYSCSNQSCANPILLNSFSGTSLPEPINTTGTMMVVWNGLDVCCPQPSAVCVCDDPTDAPLLTGWEADFFVVSQSTCSAARVKKNTTAKTLRNESTILSLSMADVNGMQISRKAFGIYENSIQRFFKQSKKSKRIIKNGKAIQIQNIEYQFHGSNQIPVAEVHKLRHTGKILRSLNSVDEQDAGFKQNLAQFQGVRSSEGSAFKTVLLCGPGNIAEYGKCMGSTYKALKVIGPFSAIYPGIQFMITVYKVDAYNQTISTDSSSLLQVYAASNLEARGVTKSNSHVSISGSIIARMLSGVANFTVSIKPSFSSVDAASHSTELVSTPLLYVEGSDSGDGGADGQMLSKIYEVELQSGDKVCPLGYILSLDTAVDGARGGICSYCPEGTYSIYPLFGGSNISNPFCISCPVQALQDGGCSRGGSSVLFSLGEWRVVNGMYLLMGCPAGYQLINSVGGVFSNQIQQCLPCGSQQYVLNSHSSNFSCQPCPNFLECNGTQVRSRYPGAQYTINYRAGVYQLTGCPAGYEINYAEQDCVICPPLFFCPGSSSPSIQCPQSTFSEAGTNSSQLCLPAVFVNFAVLLPISVQDFDASKQHAFVAAVAAAARVANDRVIITDTSASSRRDSGSDVQVQAEVAASSSAEANSVVSHLNELQLNDALVVNGLPSGDLLSVHIGDSVTVVVGGLSAAQTAGVSVAGAVFLVALVAIFVFVLLRYHKHESDEEKILREEIEWLRRRLCLSHNDGFYLSYEAAPLWRRREQTVFIMRNEMEAAARLSLLQDFDVKSFDAFCHCIEYSGFVLNRAQNSAQRVPKAEQYSALCNWLLEVCKDLIEPSILKKRRLDLLAASADMMEGMGFEMEGPLAARGRFTFFQRRVSRARIWVDHNRKLWRQLRKIAIAFMDEIAPICDARFEALRCEPGAEELLRFCGPVSSVLEDSEMSKSTSEHFQSFVRCVPTALEQHCTLCLN